MAERVRARRTMPGRFGVSDAAIDRLRARAKGRDVTLKSSSVTRIIGNTVGKGAGKPYPRRFVEGYLGARSSSAPASPLMRNASRVVGALARSRSVQGLAIGAALGAGAYAYRRYQQSKGQPVSAPPNSRSRAIDVGVAGVVLAGSTAAGAQTLQALTKGVLSTARAVQATAQSVAGVTGLADAATAGATAVGVANQARQAQAVSKVAQSRAVAGAVKGRTAAAILKIAESKSTAKLDRLVSGRVVSGVARLSLPLLIARAAYNGVTGFQKDGIRGAAVGIGDAVAAGRVSASIEGYKSAGVGGVVNALTFGAAGKVAGIGVVPRTPAEVQVAATDRPGRAYLNDAAQAKAAAPAVIAADLSSGDRPAAETPNSDGVTAGYQRTDARSGKVVTVQQYDTPGM